MAFHVHGSERAFEERGYTDLKHTAVAAVKAELGPEIKAVCGTVRISVSRKYTQRCHREQILLL